MRHLIIVFFFCPAALYAQQKKQNGAPNFLMQTNMFWPDLNSSGFWGQKKIDTLYYADKQIKSISSYAVYGQNKKSNYRVGLCTDFYENGQVKSTGNYQLQYFFVCSSAMPKIVYNEYKIGEWVYYYDNGQIKAKGIYQHDIVKASSTIAGQFAKKSVISDNWLLYERDGQKAEDRSKLITEIEKSKFDF